MSYIGYSKSINAYDAENLFKLPISRFKKEHFTLKSICNQLRLQMFDNCNKLDMENIGSNLKEIKNKIKFLMSKSLKEQKRLMKVYGYSEWHHTSCHYNKTNYYCVYDLLQDRGFERKVEKELKNKNK